MDNQSYKGNVNIWETMKHTDMLNASLQRNSRAFLHSVFE